MYVKRTINSDDGLGDRSEWWGKGEVQVQVQRRPSLTCEDRVGDTDLVDSDYEVQLIRPSVRCLVLVRVAISHSFTRQDSNHSPEKSFQLRHLDEQCCRISDSCMSWVICWRAVGQVVQHIQVPSGLIRASNATESYTSTSRHTIVTFKTRTHLPMTWKAARSELRRFQSERSSCRSPFDMAARDSFQVCLEPTT